MADQQEERSCTRFLQGFQEGVGGIAVHGLGGMDEDDASPCPVGPDGEEFLQAPDLVDGDLLAGFLFFGLPFALVVAKSQGFGLQEAEIRVVALGHPAASQTLTAGQAVLPGALAQQAGGEGLGERQFSQAPGTGQKQGVGQAIAPGEEATPDRK